jgi:hypothetical protein
MKKVMCIAPSLRLAIHGAQLAGYRPNELVWIDDPEKLIGANGGRFVEVVSNRPFDALEANPDWKEMYQYIVNQGRLRWENGHGSTWTQINLI